MFKNEYNLVGVVRGVCRSTERGLFHTIVWNNAGTFIVELPTRAKIGEVIRQSVVISSVQVDRGNVLVFQCKR